MHVFAYTHIHIHINKWEFSKSYISNLDSHFLTALNITKAIVRQRTLTVIKVIVRQENICCFYHPPPCSLPKKNTEQQ